MNLVEELYDWANQIEQAGADNFSLAFDAAQEIERLTKVVAELSTQSDEIASWIVNQFLYPIETSADLPPGEPWQQKIEEAWVRMEGEIGDDKYNNEIRRYVALGGGWTPPL